MGFAVAVSVALHVGGYYWWGEQAAGVATETPAALPTHISVQLLRPAPVVELEPVPAAPRIQTESVPTEPVRAVTKPPVRPQPDRREPRASKPVVAAPSAPVPAQVEAVAPVPRADPSSAQLRARYLDTLFAHIERHKFYPSAARRQGLEASVQVSFVLSENGAIRDLRIDGGPKLLRLAAEQTLQSASPLPMPPAEVESPLRVEYLMAFALR